MKRKERKMSNFKIKSIFVRPFLGTQKFLGKMFLQDSTQTLLDVSETAPVNANT